jgi:hypothetical protein
MFALITGLALSGPAMTAESTLRHCAAIDDASARLACYDALAGRAAPDNALAAPGSVPAQAQAPAPAPERAAAATADPAAAASNFGLSAVQKHVVDEGPKGIEAHITQVVVDLNRRGYLVLDNGQTWAITDGEMLLDAGEAVTIRRGALGSFMLTSASHHSYHVRRIR